MRSLRFVLKQYQLTLILYVQELLLFLFVFLPVRAWLLNASTPGYYAYSFSADFFTEVLGRGSANLTPFFYLVAILVLLFVVTRILLLGGVFESLMNHYPGFRRFMFDCGAHGRRFVILFLLYGIPLLILTGIISRFTGNMSSESPNQMMPVYMLATSRGLVMLVAIVLSYLHTAARYRTILENRVRLAFAIKGSLFFRFFGYQLLSVILGIAIFAAAILLLFQPGTWMTVGAVALFQLALLVRIALKLASYKVLS